MKQFEYEALDQNRNKVTGKFIAENEEQLALELSRQGLYLVSAKTYTGATPSAFFTVGTGKIKTLELSMFCRQFAIMTSAGLPIIDVMGILKQQPFTSYFKKIICIIDDDIKSGSMFYEAVMKHKKAFPDFFCSMIKVGEQTGKLDVVFESLADYYEKDQKSKQKLRGALAYPIMLLGMTVGIVILMMLYIVPTFRTSMSSLEVEPEGITKVVYDLSDFFLANWLYMLAAIVAIVMLGVIFGMTEKGKYFYGYLKVRIPLLKKINIDFIASRFARSFALLLSSGLDTTESLETVKVVLGNPEVKARFDRAADDVKHGMSMSNAFNKYRLFPMILIQMVAVGERSGSVAEVLTRSCDYFDEQVETTISSITSKIQPILLGFLGVIVAILFIAIYSPMISIMNTL